MNFIFRIFFLTMSAWALTACASSSDCFRKEVFCAALITDTQGVDDQGINADAWAGLQTAHTQGLAQRVEFIASTDTRDYLKNIAYFAERGFDVIYTTGAALADETLQQADFTPASTFVILNYAVEESRPNLLSVSFPEDHAGFAAGTLAASLTQTSMVAAFCETSSLDGMWGYCEGFLAGVKFINPEIHVKIVYREYEDRENLFNDEVWGYKNASEQISHGADVIFAAGGRTGQGALLAATDLGVYAIGTERNQRAAMGEKGQSVITSFYGQAGSETQNVMRLLQQREFAGGYVGQIQYVPFIHPFLPEYGDKLSELLLELHAERVQTGVEKSH